MTRKYIICGLKTECRFDFPTMTARSEKYISDFSGEADIFVCAAAEYTAALKRSNPALSDDDCEVIGTAASFYMQLLRKNGFMLHSSAVELDGKAYFFSAPSGTGKSTHTRQWVKLFGERAHIINDDKPAIMIRENGITACGTPWSGKSDLNVNTEVPLRGICMLERSEHNFIEPLSADKAIFSILNQTVRPPLERDMDSLLTLLDRVVTDVPVWRMGCNISTDAAQIAYDAMH